MQLLLIMPSYIFYSDMTSSKLSSLSILNREKSNRIEIAIFFVQYRIEIDRLAKIPYRHSTIYDTCAVLTS